MFVFGKVNYRESISTEVLVSIVSTEKLFKKFLNNFLFLKKDQKLNTTFMNFRAFINPKNSFGCDIFIHSRKFIRPKKKTENAIRQINSR